MRKILTRNGPHRIACNLIPNQVTAQAVSHWLLTTEGQVPSQGSLCDICDGERGTGCFSEYSVFLSVILLLLYIHSPIIWVGHNEANGDCSSTVPPYHWWEEEEKCLILCRWTCDIMVSFCYAHLCTTNRNQLWDKAVFLWKCFQYNAHQTSDPFLMAAFFYRTPKVLDTYSFSEYFFIHSHCWTLLCISDCLEWYYESAIKPIWTFKNREMNMFNLLKN